MGDTATGTWTSRELGTFIGNQKAAEFVATINSRAASDFGEEIASDPVFGDMKPEQKSIAQMFYVLGYAKGSLTTALEINKMLAAAIEKKEKESKG